MGKVKIGENEFTEEEALELIGKGQDYTKKTMELAEEKKNLESETEYMQALRGMDEYATSHPEFRTKLDNLVESERAKAEGRPFNPDQTSSSQDPVDTEEEEFVSKSELKKILKNVVTEERKNRQFEDSQKTITEQVNKDFEVLRSQKYTKEELEKIGAIAKQSNRFPVEIAERMIFRNELPNRFIKEEKESEEDNPKLLKGSSGSGFTMSEDEQEYIKTGGDPGEMLKEKLAKTPGLLFKKE